jgi:hypothetical protein
LLSATETLRNPGIVAITQRNSVGKGPHDDRGKIAVSKPLRERER